MASLRDSAPYPWPYDGVVDLRLPDRGGSACGSALCTRQASHRGRDRRAAARRGDPGDGFHDDRARLVAREACEKATVTVAAETPTAQIRSLVSHLRASGQLTAGLILRAFLSGNVRLFEEALAELSEMPIKRVGMVVHYGGGASLRALFERAGLPPSTYPAFKQAIEAMREGDLMSEPGGSARLKRRMIERVLTGCENEALDELAPLLTLLRRFATEAAREEARLLCDDMLGNAMPDDDIFAENIEPDEQPRAA